MRKMCKDCLHFAHCKNIPSYPVTNNTIACDDWVSKDKYVPVVHGPCDWCNGEYHTKIIATAIRYHSNGNMDGYEMKVNHCPHCGAKMDGGNEDA